MELDTHTHTHTHTYTYILFVRAPPGCPPLGSWLRNGACCKEQEWQLHPRGSPGQSAACGGCAGLVIWYDKGVGGTGGVHGRREEDDGGAGNGKETRGVDWDAAKAPG